MATMQTRNPLGSNDLIASHFTLTGTPAPNPPRFSFAQRVAAAAAAGFNGVGFFIGHWESGMTAPQMRDFPGTPAGAMSLRSCAPARRRSASRPPRPSASGGSATAAADRSRSR